MQKAWAYLSNFSTSIKITAVAIVIVAPLAIFLFGFILNAARINAAYKIPGASQSWNTLLSYAEAAATNIEGGAALEEIAGLNEYGTGQRLCPQNYTFFFLGSSGKEISVQMKDGATPEVVYALSDSQVFKHPSADYIARLKEALSYTKLGPHEICQADLQDGANYHEGPEVRLRLDNAAEDPQLLHDPQWTIWYQIAINTTIKPDDILLIWVSSQTGQIVKRAGIQ